MTRNEIITIFWNGKFIKSLTNDHKDLLKYNDLLRHEIFSDVISWFECVMNNKFDDKFSARYDLQYRLQRNHEFYLTDDELKNIMR